MLCVIGQTSTRWAHCISALPIGCPRLRVHGPRRSDLFPLFPPSLPRSRGNHVEPCRCGREKRLFPSQSATWASLAAWASTSFGIFRRSAPLDHTLNRFRQAAPNHSMHLYTLHPHRGRRRRSAGQSLKYTSHYKHTSRSSQVMVDGKVCTYRIHVTCSTVYTTSLPVSPRIDIDRRRLPGPCYAQKLVFRDRTRLFFPHFHAVSPGPVRSGTERVGSVTPGRVGSGLRYVQNGRERGVLGWTRRPGSKRH